MNLLRTNWSNLDSTELRILLDERFRLPGQYDGDANKLFLPLARESCRIALTYDGAKIVAVEPGLAFDEMEWNQICSDVEQSLLSGAEKVGREYSFSKHRVKGSWRGEHSKVQILPPPADAPLAPYEDADHPFILEFPIKGSNLWRITNHRREKEHRNLTLFLNVFLSGHTSLLSTRSQTKQLWAIIPPRNETPNLSEQLSRRYWNLKVVPRIRRFVWNCVVHDICDVPLSFGT